MISLLLKSFSSWPILTSFAVAIPAINWSGAIWLKRQFGDSCTALRTGPLTLIHWSRGKITLVCHFLNDLLYFVELNLKTNYLKKLKINSDKILKLINNCSIALIGFFVNTPTHTSKNKAYLKPCFQKNKFI